jgi:hypothetical protein
MLFESPVSGIQAIVIVYIFPDGSGSSTKQKILKGDKRRYGEKHRVKKLMNPWSFL